MRDHGGESVWARLGLWSRDWAGTRFFWEPVGTAFGCGSFSFDNCGISLTAFSLPLNAAVEVASGLVLLLLVVPLDPRHKLASP